jgi:hypothetical protein
MGDIGLFTFPYQGIAVPNGIPFFPQLDQVAKTVKFVGGYVIDSTKDGIPSIVEVKKLDGDDGDGGKGWPYTSKSKFYVKVDFSGGESGGAVKAAEIAPIPDGEGEKLPDTDKIFLACEFGGSEEKPVLSKIVLRQNIIWFKSGGGGGGAFFGIITKTDDQGVTETYLQGGQVTGGEKGHFIDDIRIKDADGKVLITDKKMYLKITGDGVVVNDVLVAGFNLTGTPEVEYTNSPPNPKLPTAKAPTGGYYYLLLGEFKGNSFTPAQAGNVDISFCMASYYVSRGIGEFN